MAERTAPSSTSGVGPGARGWVPEGSMWRPPPSCPRAGDAKRGSADSRGATVAGQPRSSADLRRSASDAHLPLEADRLDGTAGGRLGRVAAEDPLTVGPALDVAPGHELAEG